MFSTRVTALLLLYHLSSLTVSKARQSDGPSLSSSHGIAEDSSYILYEMETTLGMPLDTTAVYIVPSSSGVLSTSELFPITSLSSMEVTLPLVTSTSIITVDVTMATITVTSVDTGQSSSSGGTIAAIVVSVLMLVVVIGAVVIILAVCVRRRKEKARSYSLNNSFRSTETVRSRVYINVIATSITQQPSYAENGNQTEDGGTLNQYTLPPDNSSYHIYEMTEMADEVVTEKPCKMTEMADEVVTEKPHESTEMAEEVVTHEMTDKQVEEKTQEPNELTEVSEEVTDKPQEPQEAVDSPHNAFNSRLQYRSHSVYTRGSSGCKQKRPPRRYNTVGEYEFMMPQLKAAANTALMKKHTSLPSADTSTDGHYSEISDEEDDKTQQNDTYIFMHNQKPKEQTSEEFSSFLSKWFDVDKEVNVGKKDRTISEASEEDVYITMQ